MKTVPTYSSNEGEGYFEIIRLKERNSYDFSKAHKHSYFEIFLFEKGGGFHEINFDKYSIESNSIHFVFPNKIHKVKRELDTCGYVILVSKEYLEKVNYKLYTSLFSLYYLEPILNIDSSKFSNIIEIINKIAEEKFKSDFHSKEIIESYIRILFNHFLRIKENLGFIGEQKESEFTVFINFLILVENHFLEHNLIQFYTNKLNITGRKLNSLCKQFKNCTGTKLIKERMVLEAKMMLINTDFQIKNIVYSLNYDDIANFNKFFKSYAGVSPSQFRIDYLNSKEQ